jgi:xanthine dehydrogenase accessory factor
MIDSPFLRRLKAPGRPLALVLGTNEIASAVGIALHRDGYGVLLSHDPEIPVIRRGMAFHDALFSGMAEVDGYVAVSAGRAIDAKREVLINGRIAVTSLELCDLLLIGEPGVLVDARMQKRPVMPDFRNLAQLSVGLGPGFIAGTNCDIAIETLSAYSGTIVERGPARSADGIVRKLGEAGRERFLYSQSAGRWRTALPAGQRVSRGSPVGHLGATILAAPIDGILRGIARDDTVVPAGVKLIEIDPRGRNAQWLGTDARGRVIAKATLEAVRSRLSRGQGAGLLRLVHSV